MFGWGKGDRGDEANRKLASEEALEQSILDYEEVQRIKPAVEKTVRGHLRLQFENNFAARIAAVYSGQEESV